MPEYTMTITPAAKALLMNRLHTVAPDWLPAEVAGERVIGWRLMTTPGASGAEPAGYQIVTEGAIYESDMDGVLYRATVLNMIAIGSSEEEEN